EVGRHGIVGCESYLLALHAPLHVTARGVGRGSGRRCLTVRAKAAGAPPARERVVHDSPCPPGHNTPLPLKRSPLASFKRLLGGWPWRDSKGRPDLVEVMGIV